MINPLISIIVPVYNVEHYLSDCLDSLVKQSYKNLEIICINDESPDNSHKILEEYSQTDSRIIVINQKNTGISGARNRGIKAATGDYIMFLDSDDWLELNTCEISLDTVQRYNADVVFWSYVKEYPGHSIRKKIFSENTIEFSDSDVKEKLQRRFCGLYNEELKHPENADAIVPVWGKLYKAELIKKHNVSFVDLNLIGTSEDALFNFQLFNFVTKAVFLNKDLNHYRKYNPSSITTIYKPKLYKQWLHLFDLMDKIIIENNLNKTFTQALNNRVALSIIGLGLNEISRDTTHLNKINTVKEIIISDKYKKAYKDLTLEYFPIHWKVFFFLAKCGNSIGLYLLLNIIKKIIKS